MMDTNNQMPTVIRPMNEQDWQDVVEIYEQGLKTGIATFQTTAPDYPEWNSAHLPSCRLIAEHGGKVAGWAALSPVSKRAVYSGVQELSIYIAKEYRGLGIGKLLMNAIIAESEKNGIWMLQSSIFQLNTPSLILHEQCGFREVGFREKIARDYAGKWQNTVIMERRSAIDPE